MEKTYKFTLPQNKEVTKTNVRVEDGKVIVDVEFKEEFKPKDGDFVIDDYGDVFIYNKKLSTRFSGGCYVGYNSKWNELVFGVWNHSYVERLATPEEKSAFLARLEKECGKRWNPETKQLEDIRWRAKEGCQYWFVSTISTDISIKLECNAPFDDERYNSGNYFKTNEAAKKVDDQIKDIFKNSKAE